jgi:hypothetical protein
VSIMQKILVGVRKAESEADFVFVLLEGIGKL